MRFLPCTNLLSRGKDRFSQPRRSLRRLRPCCSRGRTEVARRTTSPLAVARGPMDLLLAAVLADAASSAPVFTAAHFLSGNAQHDDSVAFFNFKPDLSEPAVALASSGISASPLLCARTFGLTLLHTRALPRCTCSRACTVLSKCCACVRRRCCGLRVYRCRRRWVAVGAKAAACLIKVRP